MRHLIFLRRICPHVSLLSRFVLLAVLAPFLSSCTHYYYSPNSHNVPLFQKKNEARVSVGGSVMDEAESGEIQAAYAVTNNLGIMANGYYVDTGSDGERRSGYFVELGGGYFKPLGDKFVFEVYGGLGEGSIENKYSNYNRINNSRDLSSSQVNFIRYFIQPSIGSTTPYFDFAFSSRVSLLNYHSIKSKDLYDDAQEHINYIASRPLSYIYEPSLLLRTGYKNIKIQTQWILSINLNNPELQQEHTMVVLSLYFMLTDKYKRRVEPK